MLTAQERAELPFNHTHDPQICWYGWSFHPCAPPSKKLDLHISTHSAVFMSLSSHVRPLRQRCRMLQNVVPSFCLARLNLLPPVVIHCVEYFLLDVIKIWCPTVRYTCNFRPWRAMVCRAISSSGRFLSRPGPRCKCVRHACAMRVMVCH